MESFLARIDQHLYDFLLGNVSIMPKRFSKWLAYYYPDARVRKEYLTKTNVFLGEGTLANIGLIGVTNEENPVYIGKNVSIAPNCTLVTCSGANNGTTINQIPYVSEVLTKCAPIKIEDNVWIGANVTILPGITVGTHSVIGAGSVVTKDVEPFSIYAGVPARKIRSIKEAPND